MKRILLLAMFDIYICKQTKEILITQFLIKSALQRKQQFSERIYTVKAIRGLKTQTKKKSILISYV